MTFSDLPEQPIRLGVTLDLFSESQWFADANAASIWLQIFAVMRLPRSTAQSRIEEFTRDLNLGRPVRFTLATIKDFKFPTFEFSFHADDSGQPIISLDGKDRSIPSGMYAVLSTPYRGQQIPDAEHTAKQRLSRASALIGAHFGYNLIRHCVFDGEVLSEPGQYSVPSDVFRVPQPSEGPFFYDGASAALREVASRIRSATPDVRQRIELSLEFFDRSFRDQDQFFNAWIALEVLCNGKSQRIRSRIQGCYQLKSVKVVDDELGFRQLSRWRHDYFHKGLRPQMNADVERYLQLLYLDLLRYELRLDPRKYALGFTKWRGVNLSEIGLKDRRTPEQLAAANEVEDRRKVSN